MQFDVDVAVCGGGTAGVVAAVQAARAGATCLLVEKTGLLGGTAIVAGVNFPGLFHAWGKQVIAGIGWEIVRRAVEEVGGLMPDFKHDERRHSERQVFVDRFTYAAVMDAVFSESAANVLLHSMPVTATYDRDCWRLTIACKEGLREVTARVVIDATGDANVISLAGFPVRKNATLQPGTLIFRAEGYSIEHLDWEMLTRAAQEAIDHGELRPSDLGGAAGRVCSLLRNHGENVVHVTGIDARTSEGKTLAEIAARASLLRIQRFLRRQAGLENFKIVYFAPECGIRDTVTIEGEVEITGRDYVSGRMWEDAVCYSFYPIDLHKDHGIDIRPLSEGVYPTLPLRAMLPKGSRMLLAAGRIICGDREAHSAFRVQASCMAMGQAVGAAAALASKTGVDIRTLKMTDILNLLEQHQAIIPGKISG